MSRTSVLFSLLLLACKDGRGISLDDSADGSERLNVGTLTPAWANSAGGAQVELEGGPFEADTRVWVGGAEAEVLEVQEGRVSLRVPAGSPGEVSVRVQSGPDNALRERAFTYHADATGQTGAFGAVEWYSLLGSYWEGGSSAFGLAWWGLVEPTDATYADVFGGVVDGCVSGLALPELAPVELDQLQTTLVAGDQRLEGRLSTDGFYGAVLTEAPEPGAAYDLEALGGGPLAGLSVQALTRWPAAPELTAPALGGSSAIRLARQALSLEWEPQGAEPMLVMVVLHDADQVEQEVVGCVIADDGAFTVPPELWSGAWVEDRWLFVYLGSVGRGEGLLPHNGAYSEVVGLSWALGAALTEGG